jgi:ribonuclease HII
MSRQTSFLPPETEEERLVRMQRYECELRQQGYRVIAGVDEAGRGCLAGPVVAAAVILPGEWSVPEINDSKQLSASKRDTLFTLIRQYALSFGVGIISERVIDNINILQATYQAMRQALDNLTVSPDYVLLDAVTLEQFPVPQRGIPKGDRLSISIAAASILAKVTRDRLMIEYDQQYPEYGFAGHKGYGTKHHLHAIATHGPCPIHRKTFRGVKEHLVLR